jgi:hypothetical protein
MWEKAMQIKPGPKEKPNPDNSVDNINRTARKGTSKAYTVSRLQREAPELFDYSGKHMGHHIEPALLPGHLVHEITGEETIGVYDDHTAADTPIQRLADHAGINIKQAEAVMGWFQLEEKDAVIEAAAEMLGRLFDRLIPYKANTENLKLETCGLRLIAARVLLNRDGNETLTGWAERAGCSKQILSWHIKCLEDSVGLHWLGGKRFEARAAYAESARARWAALTPEERRQRRAGYKPAAQDATLAAQI